MKQVSYQSGLIKRARRTGSEIEAVRSAIVQVLTEEHPMTVRQVFYQLVSRGVIEKSEAQYKNTVVRLLTEMRRERRIPFDWIADNTRWMRKPRSFRSFTDALEFAAESYRRALWADNDDYVEIWLEKDALAGVLYDVTADWDVPLMVTKGYPSISYLHSAAEMIERIRKPAHLYYLGDYDPSGLDITRAVEAGIREFAPSAEIYFSRVAVTFEQITEMDLPTRPTKTTDSRSKSFEGESVEVDAIPPHELRSMVRSLISQHIDSRTRARLEAIENEERNTLRQIASAFGEQAGGTSP